MRHFSQFACIDWSGARTARPRGIALAVAEAGADAGADVGADAGAVRLVGSNGSMDRDDILAWIEARIAEHSNILIGFDLAPALPFVDEGGYFPGLSASPDTPQSLWQLVESISADEQHLSAGTFVDHHDFAPYFRRQGVGTGHRFGGGIGRLRVVEQRQRHTGLARSSSCFNLVGAAQVGKASLSGMRLFHRLAGRVPFWPFDPVPETGPVLIEIYTSIAARAAGVPPNRSKIRDAATLTAALARFDTHCPPIPSLDDHATDALVTAAWMRRSAGDPHLWAPAVMTPHVAQKEGWTFGVV